LPAWLEGRVSELEARLTARQEAHASELREAQAAGGADLQVRLQAYFDQRLRESAEKERDTSVELLARMKGELDAGLNHLIDSPKLQQAVALHAERIHQADREGRERAVDEKGP